MPYPSFFSFDASASFAGKTSPAFPTVSTIAAARHLCPAQP